MSWRIDPTALVFCIQDFAGREWSKTAHPSRPALEDLNAGEERIGGFGLGLMNGLMDRVEIGYRSGGTMVSMVKELGSKPVTS